MKKVSIILLFLFIILCLFPSYNCASSDKTTTFIKCNKVDVLKPLTTNNPILTINVITSTNITKLYIDNNYLYNKITISDYQVKSNQNKAYHEFKVTITFIKSEMIIRTIDVQAMNKTYTLDIGIFQIIKIPENEDILTTSHINNQNIEIIIYNKLDETVYINTMRIYNPNHLHKTSSFININEKRFKPYNKRIMIDTMALYDHIELIKQTTYTYIEGIILIDCYTSLDIHKVYAFFTYYP